MDKRKNISDNEMMRLLIVGLVYLIVKKKMLRKLKNFLKDSRMRLVK